MAKEKIKKLPKGKESAPEKPKNRIKMGLLSIICVVMAVFLQLSFVLVLIGLCPTAVAHLVDNTKNRVKFQCVMACNVSGLLPFVAELISRGNDKHQIQALLSDPKTLGVVYMSAAFGYLLVNAAPYMAAWFVKSLNVRKAGYIYQVQESLVEEWGPEIIHADPK